MYANINRQMAKQINTTLWKFCREQQNSQMSEVNSHPDLYIHYSMDKFYVLWNCQKKQKRIQTSQFTWLYKEELYFHTLTDIQENPLKVGGLPLLTTLLPNHRTCRLCCSGKKPWLTHVMFYFLLFKKAESVFILRENKPKPNKLVAIVIIRKLTWILQSCV